MISYEEYVEKLKTGLMVKTQLPEEKVHFCRKGEKFAENGDRLVIECVEAEKEKGALGVYIRELYEEDPQGEAVSEMVSKIAEEVRQVQESRFLTSAKKLRSFEDAKTQIMLKAVNYNRNEKDLALTVYFNIGEMKGGTISTKLRKSQIERWNKSEEEIFQLAANNMMENAEPRIYCWQKMIFDLEYEGEEFMNRADNIELNKGPLGNCMSTREKSYGATVLFLPGVAERLAELLDGDFYAVFTSVHEVMIHAVETADVDDLKAVLAETLDDMTPEEEVLTKYIYRYDRVNRKFIQYR